MRTTFPILSGATGASQAKAEYLMAQFYLGIAVVNPRSAVLKNHLGPALRPISQVPGFKQAHTAAGHSK